VPPETYIVDCWNCRGDFDALSAVWCSDDPKNPTKLCPFCLRCFCAASEKFKQDFWRGAPARLRDELQTLSHSKDRLGDVLIRMKKLTTPQLLEALVEQRQSGRKLGEILVERKLVSLEDIEAALRTQGVSPLTDTAGVAFSGKPVWDAAQPDAMLDYLLGLAVRKGASDVQIEPGPEVLGVKYRIDGFSFRLDPIPKAVQPALTRRLLERLGLDPLGATSPPRPLGGRTQAKLAGVEYDLVAQLLPTPHGLSAAIKLVNRATFIKDFATLGLDLEDRVRLLEELRGGFGLALVSAPVYNGARTTAYSVMNFLVHAQRDVVSLESPVQWPHEGVRQVEVADEPEAMVRALRSAIAVHPDAILLSSVPDSASARLLSSVAPSLLVVAVLPAQSAAHAVAAMAALGVPHSGLATVLSVALCQRLVRQVCRICREPAPAPAAQTLALHGVSPEEAAGLRFFRGRGCPTCNRVGYRGRRALFEVMNGAPEVRQAVGAALSPAELSAIAERAGMRPLRARCLDLVREGVTTFDEFARLRL
jgi:type II secretory ATPase GspE/PulE/Tfp pilus assembly ATPase PilB-like protein